ncbi:TPA: hypothetical protein MDD69_001193 [Klebsiella oxytoca]|nr:hypothetical protein [Klebsiella oxytoca]
MIVNILFRLLLTFNATSLLVIVFFVQKKFTLGYFLQFYPQVSFLRDLHPFISYFLYFMIPVLLTALSIFLSRGLGSDDFKEGDVVSIEHANNSFLPSYLGYFFVALSISSWSALFFVYGILFIFTFLSQALYFNPLFLIFRYEFYNIQTKGGASIFLISKYKYKTPKQIVISRAFRINDYTFIERK